MSEHSREYREYINSYPWRQRRHQAIVRASRTCERCGVVFGHEQAFRELQVHHVTYDRLGHERDADLRVLCRPCHAKADEDRRAATAARVWEARLDGWASKKYGDDWEWSEDRFAVEEAFEEWLDQRDEDW